MDVEFDDSYADAIELAVDAVGEEHAIIARSLLRASTRTWADCPDYDAARTLIRAGVVDRGVEIVRLEIGNANDQSYEVVWVVRSPHDVWLVTNLAGSLRKSTLPVSAWELLMARLDAVGLPTLQPMIDLAVDDGSAFFVSVCYNDLKKQIVFYGLPSEEQSPYRRLVMAIRDIVVEGAKH